MNYSEIEVYGIMNVKIGKLNKTVIGSKFSFKDIFTKYVEQESIIIEFRKIKNFDAARISSNFEINIKD